SSDAGLSWAKPREISASAKQPDWRWYATGPGNGIQLRRGEHKGRLVIPANHSEHPNGSNAVSRSHVLYSDDHGQSWHLGGSEEELTNESGVVELADGALLHNMRSNHKKNRRAVATSRDGGLTWSGLTLAKALVEPVCQASILRYSWPESGQKSCILFSNPASAKRENLTVRLSEDEGATWPVGRTLHAGPAAYSSLAVLPDRTIACLYESGEANPYQRIVLARFPLSWLMTGEPDHSAQK
ncbi:MAG TPA: sialidase family protein, partial [Bacillota bacterium]|nr:sialidase family protein [Bacillota bacterium]